MALGIHTRVANMTMSITTPLLSQACAFKLGQLGQLMFPSIDACIM
jgi:hypothetical protein